MVDFLAPVASGSCVLLFQLPVSWLAGLCILLGDQSQVIAALVILCLSVLSPAPRPLGILAPASESVFLCAQGVTCLLVWKWSDFSSKRSKPGFVFVFSI